MNIKTRSMFNGQKIKDIIYQKGLSQKEVFNRAGIKEATYYSLFKEEANPTSNILESIANVLECSIDEFFDRTNGTQSIQIGYNITGNGNKVGNIELNECRAELVHLNEIIKQKDALIAEKERTIQLLINK